MFCMQEFKFVSLEDVRRMLEELPQDQKEALLAEQINKLSAQAKAKIMGLADSGLTIVTGSFVNLNSDVAVNIQNASGFDAEQLFKAVIEYRKQNNKG